MYEQFKSAIMIVVWLLSQVSEGSSGTSCVVVVIEVVVRDMRDVRGDSLLSTNFFVTLEVKRQNLSDDENLSFTPRCSVLSACVCE